MIDLARAAKNHHNNVCVRSFGGIFDYFQYRSLVERANFTSLGAIKRSELSENSPKLKLYKRPLNFLATLQRAAMSDYQPNIVIDDIASPASVIEKYRNDGCEVWLNHAGSPEAFFSYFLARNTENVGKKAAIENYCMFLKQYDGILFQSDIHCATAKKLIGNRKNIHFEVLYPSCNEAAAYKAQNGQSPYKGEKNIVIVGSVQPRKGHHLLKYLSEASANYTEKVNFHIVGNILDREYFEDQVKPLLKVANIHFYNFRSDYLSFIAHADVLIQLSDKEGFSRVLREAMYLGVPIVTFRIEGWEDIFSGYGHKHIIQPGNIQGFSDSLFELVSDLNERKKFSDLARLNYDNLCSQEKYLQRFSQIFME